MPDIPETVEIHNEALVLLKKFDELCRQNGIKYSIHGGTLLGAIRHGGFIPWDDDVDITLTRSEFEKLLTVFKKIKLEEEYYFDTFGSSFYKFYSQRKDKPIVWIDLFVWDYISSNRTCQKIKILLLTFFKAFCKPVNKLRESQDESHYSIIQFIGIALISIIGSLFPKSMKNRWVETIRKSLTGNKELIHRANDQYKGIKLILPKYVMSEYIEIEFETITLQASKYWKEILESTYGMDYMIPRRENDDIELHARFRNRNEELRKEV